MVNVLFFCLLGWSVFQISKQLGGLRAGWYGLSLLALTGDLIWEGLYSGLEMPYMALVVLCAVGLLRAVDWKGAVGAGAILAFVVFLRPTALAFLPLALLLLPRERQQRNRLMACFVGVALILSGAGCMIERRLSPPPMNQRAPFNHTAFNLMLETARFPGTALDTTLQRVDWDTIRQHRGQVIAKLARGLEDTPVRLASVLPFWLLILAVWGVARSTERAKLVPTAWGLAAAGLLLIVGMNLTTAYTLPRHFLAVVALLIPLAAVGAQDVLAQLRLLQSGWRRLAAVSLLVVVISYGPLFRLVEKSRIPGGLGARQVALHVQNLADYVDPVGASYSVASDVAWYGRRRTVVLPNAPEDCRNVVETVIPNSVLVIGEHDQREVFSQVGELFPGHEVAGTFTVRTSQWTSPYHVLRDVSGRGGREP